MTAAGQLSFTLPPGQEATTTPERRGIGRDGVRLLVAERATGALRHLVFNQLPSVLSAGDVLVVNTSATLPAALDATTGSGPAALHLSGSLPGRLWQVELRHLGPDGSTAPWLDAAAGTQVHLPAGATARLLAPAAGGRGQVRLWIAALDLPAPLLAYLAEHGKPIRYGYIREALPLSAYQTVFAEHPGSAEMPSAARPFSAELVARLVRAGVVFAPFVLHCGVSSGEAHEPPPTEWFLVPPSSAEAVNAARRRGNRVIGVGTTSVRALETVSVGGVVHAGEGWTDLVVQAGREVTSVDGLVTGWHEPHASHLDLLEAVAGRSLLEASYTAALDEGYLWHELGDSHLILP